MGQTRSFAKLLEDLFTYKDEKVVAYNEVWEEVERKACFSYCRVCLKKGMMDLKVNASRSERATRFRPEEIARINGYAFGADRNLTWL
jgi:hypothetical protein